MMKKKTKQTPVTIEKVNEIATKVMNRIYSVMKFLSEDTIGRSGMVCENTVGIFEIYSETEHTSCFAIVNNRDNKFDSAAIDTHLTIIFVVIDTATGNVVFHEHLRLLDERDGGEKLNNPRMGWLWYCIDIDSPSNLHEYVPGKSNEDLKYYKHMTAYQTLFIKIYRDTLVDVSRDTSPMEFDYVSASHYNFYNENSKANGVTPPDIIDYQTLIHQFWDDSQFTPHNVEATSTEKKDDDYIKMDGEYHEFEGGAIRYTKTGKGKFDLIPWETVKLITDKIIDDPMIDVYTTEMDVLITLTHRDPIELIINITAVKYGDGVFTADAFAWMLRDLAIHYEKGAEKYGVDNWKKGIPASSFWDSGCRHTCQFINGMVDEPHWISAIWNMIGYLWTINKES